MRKQYQRHRGMAYLMVMLTVSIGAILGMATLASTTLSAQATAAQQLSTQAACAADSGAQIAMYGLQNTSSVPASWTSVSGHAIYTTNSVLPNDGGSIDLDAVRTTTRDTYRIAVTGRSALDATVSRSVISQARIARAKPLFAGIFSGPVTVNTKVTFNGPVLSSGSVTLAGSGTITGTLRTTVASTDFVVPTASTVNYYGAGVTATAYTMPDGITTGLPEALSSTITTFPTASTTNPGHVFYCNGDLTINTTGALTLNGTLIVKGNLTITGINGNITISPLTQMPALVVSGYIKPNSRNQTVTVNGVVWSGVGFAWGSAMTASQFNIFGCLLLPNGAVLGSPSPASFTAKYLVANADVPDIAITPQPITGVRVLSYIVN